MSGLEITGLCKSFGSTVVLDDVHLTVGEGELVVLVGPSGCGKSTLLRVVAGLETPDAGRVAIGRSDVTACSPQSRDLAFVFQSYALYPHLTVRGNLEFPLRARRVPALERARRVEATAGRMGLDGLLERKPAALSGGQRQRVAMGRAMIREPRLFLFDEPLSNLDAQLRSSMRVELVELHRSLGTTSLYVTHDQGEAMTLGERIAVMRDGRIEQVGPPREIDDHPATTFVATFLGSPPMTLLEGDVAVEGGVGRFRFAGGELEMPASIGSGATTLGIRPEAWRVAASGLAATVRLVEDLGADRFVLVDLAGAPAHVRLASDQPTPRAGETLALEVVGAMHPFRAGRRVDLVD